MGATLSRGCTLVMGTRGDIRVAGGRTDVILQVEPRDLAGLDIGDFLSDVDRDRLFAELRHATGSTPRRLRCALLGRERTVSAELTLAATPTKAGSGDRWVLRCEPLADEGPVEAVADSAPVGTGVDAPPPTRSRLDLSATAIERALWAEEFDLDYQPIVDLATGLTVGFEALVRWVVPGRGRVVAGAFLPAVEDAGLMPNLSRLVLERGLRFLADLPPDAADRGITVNVSASDLARRGFALDVGRIVADSGIDPRRLMLEFTEEAHRLDPTGLPAMLARLRDFAGVQLALDDYGSALSSASALTLPVDVIKLDRSVTTGAGNSPARALLGTFMDRSRDAGTSVIGEGVEEPAQLYLLEQAGCQYAQGYLLGRPGPAADQH